MKIATKWCFSSFLLIFLTFVSLGILSPVRENNKKLLAYEFFKCEMQVQNEYNFEHTFLYYERLPEDVRSKYTYLPHFRWLLVMTHKVCFFPAASVCFNLHSLGHKPVQCILLSTVVFMLLQKGGKNPTNLFLLITNHISRIFCYLYLFLQVFFFPPLIHIQYLPHTNYNFLLQSNHYPKYCCYDILIYEEKQPSENSTMQISCLTVYVI